MLIGPNRVDRALLMLNTLECNRKGESLNFIAKASGITDTRYKMKPKLIDHVIDLPIANNRE